jgi:hypothetical protein
MGHNQSSTPPLLLLLLSPPHPSVKLPEARETKRTIGIKKQCARNTQLAQ